MLLQHQAVPECPGVGVPADQEAGEVMAFLVLAPGTEVSAETLWEFFDLRLPHSAVPRYLPYLPELPKTPSEEIQKGKLRHLRSDGVAGLDARPIINSRS